MLGWVINQFYALGADFIYKKFIIDTVKEGDANRAVLNEFYKVIQRQFTQYRQEFLGC
jgi:hypothetical protein